MAHNPYNCAPWNRRYVFQKFCKSEKYSPGGIFFVTAVLSHNSFQIKFTIDIFCPHCLGESICNFVASKNWRLWVRPRTNRSVSNKAAFNNRELFSSFFLINVLKCNLLFIEHSIRKRTPRHLVFYPLGLNFSQQQAAVKNTESLT